LTEIEQKQVDQNLLVCYNKVCCKKHVAKLNLINFVNQLKRQLKMATEKLFTVAGTATQNGVTKARFANDLVARIKILNKAGCTDINLIELPHAMTKLQALQHLQTVGITEGDAGYAVANKLAEKAKVAKAAEVRVAVKPAALKAKAKQADAAEA
jgi:Ethanolamine utilization protein EutJ (predicted chaperonin)